MRVAIAGPSLDGGFRVCRTNLLEIPATLHALVKLSLHLPRFSGEADERRTREYLD